MEIESIPESSISPPLSSNRRMEPLSTFCSPAIASRSSFCPLPEMPAIPRISPVLTVRSTSSSVLTFSLCLTVDSLNDQTRFYIFRFRTFDVQIYFGSNHHSERLCTLACAVSTVSIILTLSKNCNAVRQSKNLLQFMGNDNDRTSIVTHVSKNIEQPVGFLWRQHCCRLIQDQDPCSTIQHLHNFNCLFSETDIS